MTRRSRLGVTSVVALAGATVVGVGVSLLRDGISTREEPPFLERRLARAVRHLAISTRARALSNPVPFDEAVFAEARAHFADHCASCHANDGSGQTSLGRSLYPRAPDMRTSDTQQLSDGELYSIIKNGVRLTGMPAWGEPGDDDVETWKLVHLLRRLNTLTEAQLAEMQTMNPRNPIELEEERQDAAFLAGEGTGVK